MDHDSVRLTSAQQEIAKAADVGILCLPVLYSGFSWGNLRKLPPGTSVFPRERGMFYWKQFCRAAESGLDMVCVAMFDEVDREPPSSRSPTSCPRKLIL